MDHEFLIVTHKHGLTPFAHRLRTEGHNADILVWRKNYRKAWDGKFVSITGGEPTAEETEKIRKAVEESSIIVLSDFHEWEADYPTSPPACQSYLRIGAWVDQDGNVHEPHMLIYDMGVWPGNMGRICGGGLTLVRLGTEMQELGVELLGELGKLPPGLVEADVSADETGELVLQGVNHGWNWLQSHAFVGELENFGDTLAGGTPVFSSNSKFTCVAPLSIPPWPEHGRHADEVDIEATPEVRGRVLWHDVVIDKEQGSLRSAGLDGLLGVGRGVGNSPGLARTELVQTLASIGAPEKQWRPDVGHQVEIVLDSVERLYGVSVWAA